MATALTRTGETAYSGMLVGKAPATGWSRPALLAHFVEANGASTLFMLEGEEPQEDRDYFYKQDSGAAGVAAARAIQAAGQNLSGATLAKVVEQPLLAICKIGVDTLRDGGAPAWLLDLLKLVRPCLAGVSQIELCSELVKAVRRPPGRE